MWINFGVKVVAEKDIKTEHLPYARKHCAQLFTSIVLVNPLKPRVQNSKFPAGKCHNKDSDFSQPPKPMFFLLCHAALTHVNTLLSLQLTSGLKFQHIPDSKWVLRKWELLFFWKLQPNHRLYNISNGRERLLRSMLVWLQDPKLDKYYGSSLHRTPNGSKVSVNFQGHHLLMQCLCADKKRTTWGKTICKEVSTQMEQWEKSFSFSGILELHQDRWRMNFSLQLFPLCWVTSYRVQHALPNCICWSCLSCG